LTQNKTRKTYTHTHTHTHTHVHFRSLSFPEFLAHLLPTSYQADITHVTLISCLSLHSLSFCPMLLCVSQSPLATSTALLSEKDKRERERYSSCEHEKAKDWQRIRAMSTNKSGPKACAEGMPKLFYDGGLWNAEKHTSRLCRNAIPRSKGFTFSIRQNNGNMFCSILGKHR